MMKLLLLSLVTGLSSLARAEDVAVAVAANFTAPLQKLSAVFLAETGHRAAISSGATGQLYAQIKNGAPFDVLLSADQATPRKLIQEGAAVSGSEFTYAIGRLVLWSAKKKTVDAAGEVLTTGTFRHLALANPKLAPYGAAAREVLEKKGLWDKLQPRLVTGESVAQAHQFVTSGNAELGFVAFSQVVKDGAIRDGSFWIVPPSLYSPLKQDAVLLKKGEKSAAAKKFLEFLQSEKARAVIRDYGYERP